MTNEERARRYLQASMNASYTHLPAHAREAYEDQMRHHERRYKRVHEHALAGADKDFDEALTPGEREHQTYLRRKEGMQLSDVHRIRKELRGETRGREHSPRSRRASESRSAPKRRPHARAAIRTPAIAAGAAGSAISAGATGRGNIFLQAIGILLILSLFYLLVAGKGVGALTGIINTIVGGVGAFVRPVDPIQSLENALGATNTNPNTPGHELTTHNKAGGVQDAVTSAGGTKEEKSIVSEIAGKLGWKQADWEGVIERESGWSTTAANPTTGAYGIGQLNPENASNPKIPRPGSTASKYPGYDSPSARTQLETMARYIKNAYGTPTKALEHENQYGWY